MAYPARAYSRPPASLPSASGTPVRNRQVSFLEEPSPSDPSSNSTGLGRNSTGLGRAVQAFFAESPSRNESSQHLMRRLETESSVDTLAHRFSSPSNSPVRGPFSQEGESIKLRSEDDLGCIFENSRSSLRIANLALQLGFPLNPSVLIPNRPLNSPRKLAISQNQDSPVLYLYGIRNMSADNSVPQSPVNDQRPLSRLGFLPNPSPLIPNRPLNSPMELALSQAQDSSALDIDRSHIMITDNSVPQSQVNEQRSLVRSGNDITPINTGIQQSLTNYFPNPEKRSLERLIKLINGDRFVLRTVFLGKGTQAFCITPEPLGSSTHFVDFDWISPRFL